MDKLATRNMLGPIALAAALALGVAAVWGFTSVWTQKRLDDWIFHSMDETLEITRDGRALIRHMQHLDGTWVFSYRTPDGQDVTEPLALTAPYVGLWPAPTKPEILGWSWRVLGYSDTRTVAAEWYLIREDTAPGRAYFAIYDSQTRELVGYFSRHGFRSGPPSADEQFSDVPRYGCEALPIAFEEYGWAQWGRTASLYLIAQGALWSIDLETRSLRPIAVPGEPVSVSLATEQAAGDVGSVSYQMVVRTRDKIVFLDKSAGTQRTLPIPASIRDRSFTVCNTAANEVVLTAPETPGDVDVFWLGAADGAQRHEHVRLAGVRSAGEEAAKEWYIAVVLPAPVLQAVAYPFIAYLVAETGNAANVKTALARLLARDWPAILAIWALSAVLAAICYRHQARYDDRGGAAWALFVFVMGVPGAIGYWLHRRWPATERCAQCGATAPRDRDSCLACATVFAEPALKGIEVLA